MKNFVQTTTIENKNTIVCIVKGMLLSYFITFLLLLLFSILLTYTNIAENSIAPVILIITIISILVGSSIGTNKIKKNVFLYGGTIGFFYIMILYLISSLLQTGFSVNLYAILMIIFSILAGMVGRNCRCKLKKIIDKLI